MSYCTVKDDLDGGKARTSYRIIIRYVLYLSAFQHTVQHTVQQRTCMCAFTVHLKIHCTPYIRNTMQ